MRNVILALGLLASSQASAAIPTDFVCKAEVIHGICGNGLIQVTIKSGNQYELEYGDVPCWFYSISTQGQYATRDSQHDHNPVTLFELGNDGTLEYSAQQQLATLKKQGHERSLKCEPRPDPSPRPTPSANSQGEYL